MTRLELTDGAGRPSAKPMRCVTIDVEEYFHIEAAFAHVSRDEWATMPRRVEGAMDRLLALFDEMACSATFFVLGDVAKHHPQLIRRCSEAGHEICSHGFNHDRLHRLSPNQLRAELIASRVLLQDLTGQAVAGFRAPTWSVTRQTAWAVDVLAQAGYQYDASVFPVHHPAYGVPDAPTSPFTVTGPAGGRLLELPPLTWQVRGRNVAVAGGGYFRLLPLWLMKKGLSQAEADGRPAILYFHPWEFDPGIPRLPLPLLGRIRTYTGLGRSLGKLRHILSLYRGSWTRIDAHLPSLLDATGQPTMSLARAA